jgi:hypothetical protein
MKARCLCGAVLVVKPEFEVWKHTVVAKRDNLPGHVKLLPEYRRVLELLNKVADILASILGAPSEKCEQETRASQQGFADSTKGHSEDSTAVFEANSTMPPSHRKAASF